jgi:hypothetical protein
MHFAHRYFQRVLFLAASSTLVLSLGIQGVALGQTTTTTTDSGNHVGGVSIDTEGLLSNTTVDQAGVLSKKLRQSLEKIPADLNPAVEMRKVSLRGLAEALEACAKDNKPIPDAVRYLAGLQRVRYVIVYPEQKDIVLAGPGEGWRVDDKGNVVGVATGRPVMLLDDLLVALRTAKAAANGGITCSIDPTSEGLAKMNKELPALTKAGDPKALADGIESVLGMQRISVQGVPASSHFARVLVAADYRMKRIAMNFDPSPVRGLTSYLQMVKAGARAVVSPRFWLEPKYEALLKDGEGLTFELQGSGVKAMTEEDFIASTGDVKHSGKASTTAKRWADTMTEKYAELAVKDPIFGQLQNCMDLAVVGALIVKERLADKAGCSLPALMDSPDVKVAEFSVPKQVESKASVLKKGRNWVISVSGGVAISSWEIADKAKKSDSIAPVREKAALAEKAGWYSN